MQVNSPAASRAAWYDRNPSTQFHWDNTGALGPHSTTSTFIYTVPSGKKCIWELGHLWVYRDTAATTVGLATAYLYYAPGSTNDQEALRLDCDSNTIPNPLSQDMTTTVMMQETDQCYGQTGDSSVGGTVTYLTEMKGTEFDA